MINNKKIFLAFFLAFQLTVAQKMLAQETDLLVSFADNFDVQAGIESKSIKDIFLLNDSAGVKNYVINYDSEGGFKLVKFENKHFQVSGFSEKGTFSTKENLFFGKEKIQAKVLKFDAKLRPIVTEVTNLKKVKSVETVVEPFLTDVWGGVNCTDNNGSNIYPTNYYTPSHCSPGCVAISTSQVMNYYKWPIVGMGNNSYSDIYNTSTTVRHESFFDNTYYDWANMLDIYYGASSTTQQQQAVGALTKSVGVALEMDYEPAGSTSNVTKVPAILTNYFRYSSHYELKTWASFWTRLKENILSHIPVSVAVTASRTGAGHDLIINGFKEINGLPYYYLNWGWWNNNNINGWYNIQAWTTSNTGYNVVDGAVLDILPTPQITSIAPIGNGNDFTINWEASNKLVWDEFTLQQKVDNGDWIDVATGIKSKNYTILNPTGKVYLFRVKTMYQGSYFLDSWSEIAVYAVSGKYNGYASFDGLQNASAAQSIDSDLTFSGDYTFETWIRIKAGNVSGNVIFDQRDSYAMELRDVTLTEYSVAFRNLLRVNDELLSNTAGLKLKVGDWYHIAVSKTGTTAKLYVNGTVCDTNTDGTFTLSTSNYTLNLGEKYRSSYTSFIYADMDQLRFSNIGRYSALFTPNRNEELMVDANTKAYFTFQNIHSNRLKDNAFNFSMKATNVSWKYEQIDSQTGVVFPNISNEVKIFPNPVTNGVIHIQLSDAVYFTTYNIFDTAGKLVQSGDIKTENKKDIQVNGLKNGVYTLNIKNNVISATTTIIIIN